MTNKQKFILTNDEDGHWYIIPESKKDEFDNWLDLVYSEEADCGDMPEWAKCIDGPHSIIIHEYSEV